MEIYKISNAFNLIEQLIKSSNQFINNFLHNSALSSPVNVLGPFIKQAIALSKSRPFWSKIGV